MGKGTKREPFMQPLIWKLGAVLHNLRVGGWVNGHLGLFAVVVVMVVRFWDII